MKKLAFALTLFALPFIAFAAVQGNDLEAMITFAGRILNMLIPLLIAAALVVFFWGLLKYVRTGGAGHKEGMNTMVAGLIALFVMVSVWGIIRIAQNTLGVTSDRGNITAPRIPPQGN